jgi:predicted esterase
VFQFSFTHIADYTTSNPLTSPAWVARLNQNKLGSMPPKVPIFMYGGQFDEIVGLGQQLALRQTYCTAGVNVTWKTYFGEHASTLVAGACDAPAFLADRFAGKPVTRTC